MGACVDFAMGDEDSYKIVVAGVGAVGKSALTLRLCSGKFPKKYDPTIEDSYRKKLDVDGQVRTLDILDTAGQDEYRTLRMEFKDQIDKACAKIGVKVPIVLVGNKCDLAENRTVMKKMGEQKVKEWKESKGRNSAIGDIVFMEASAKEDTNVAAIFETLVRSMNKESGGSSGAGNASQSGGNDDNNSKQSPHEEHDKPSTKEESSKGGGCKCSIQ